MAKIINNEDDSLRAAPIVAGVGFLIFFTIGLLMRSMGVTIENKELALSVIFVSTIVPFFTLTSIFYRKFKADAAERKMNFDFNYWFWKDLVLGLTYAIIFGAVGFAISVVVALSFKGFVYQPYTFALWPALAAAAWAYFSINLAKNFKPADIINVTGVFLVGGVALSAILNPNPKWWEESISYLGMNHYESAKILNLTLILSGALLLVLSTYFARWFEELKNKNLINARANQFLKLVFVTAPIGLACVGLFPYKPVAPRMYIHNLSAFFAFGLFGITMLLSLKITPFFSKYYQRINYLLFLVLGVILTMNLSGYLTLALTETMAFGVIAVWLVLFFRNLTSYVSLKL